MNGRPLVNPQHQGRAFEQTFRELLERIIEKDLGYTLLECVEQPSGSQLGKDLQVTWKEETGREVSWHFECKDWLKGSLPAKEVADKIFDVARSAHRIDVWCLVAGHAEPSPGLDELLAWATENLDLQFALTTLSRTRQALKRLYALHQDLFAQQYPDDALPQLSEKDAAKVRARFATFLREQTYKGDAAKLRRDRSWQIVGRDTVPLGKDDPEAAAAYIKGLVAIPPWDAVAYGWATPRTSIADRLTARVLDAERGMDFVWLVGGGGEGKSTALRQVAWKVATENAQWIVLWSDRYLRNNEADIPLAFIEALGDEARLLICIDDSTGVGGGEQLRRVADRWKALGARLVVVVADRGLAWLQSPLRRALSRGTSQADHREDLPSLSPAEVRALLESLSQRKLLHNLSLAEAEARVIASQQSAMRQQARFGDRSESVRSYLLPVLLEVTDPHARGFESILRDVLVGLRNRDTDDALDLLLAGSLTHAAGFPLTTGQAAGLIPAGANTDRALLALTEELNTQFATNLAPGLSAPARVLVTHHPVLAATFVQVAAGTQELEPFMLRIAEAIPLSFAADMDLNGILPPYQFTVLDMVPRSLVGSHVPLFAVACSWLRGFERLIPDGFPTIHRLAYCYYEWIVHMAKHSSMIEEVGGLVELSRSSYRRELAAVDRVLAPDTARPQQFGNYDLVTQRLYCWHAWAVLEIFVGTQFDEPSALWRGLFLALLSMGDDPEDMSRALVSLADALIGLERYEMAGAVVSVGRDIGRSKGTKIGSHQAESLLKQGADVPTGGRSLLDDLLGDLAPEILDRLDDFGVYDSRQEHLRALQEAFEWAAGRFSPNVRMRTALDLIVSMD
jgi:hypothetical protein